MKQIDEIKKNFDTQFTNGIVKLESFDNTCWTIKDYDSFGVAIENKYNISINEYFNNVRIYNLDSHIEGEKEIGLIIITSNYYSLRNEFASICMSFLEDDYRYRDNLQADPYIWWETWRELLGNAIKTKKVFDVVGELMVYAHVLKSKKADWKGPNGASVDIETDEEQIEVKTTLNKYRDIITVSSQFQLLNRKNSYLYFCKLEKSNSGDSINSLVKKIIKLGGDVSTIEDYLVRLGYLVGSRDRDIRYELLEGRRYKVEDSFPKIDRHSFKENKVPDNIVKIVYDISLDGLEYEVWS